MTVTAADVLAALDPEQRLVAEALEGPVVVWAGAGSGKTRAITHRMAHAALTGAHDPRRTLALTFTTRAAGEMRDRLRLLGVEGVQARTFHSAALRQLRHFWPRVIGGQAPQVLGRAGPVVAEAANRCRVPTDQAVIRDLVAEIAWAKQMQIDPDHYTVRAVHRQPPVAHAEVARVYAAYDDLKHERGQIDFDDVLLMTVGMLDTRPDVIDEVRNAYRWFTIDEFQDVSPVQHRLLDLWLGDRDDICVVGDAAQTIYSFAGATDRFLLDFPQRFPEATQVRLFRSYRCNEPIVDLANRILAAGAREHGPTREVARLTSMTGPGAEPTVTAYDDEVAEAEGIARAISHLIADGIPAREIAVLVRINALMPQLEEALSSLAIPLVLRGGERFFDRPEVREAITRIRGAARAGQSEGESAADQVVAVLATMGYQSQAPSGTGAVRERWESLASLVALAQSRPELDLAGLVTELDRRAESQHAPVADGVVLSTIHAAKGLEWRAVFIAGLTEGGLPHAQVTDGEGIAEERRLFYVAVTRGRDHLAMSWARSRQPGGRGTRTASRFLDEIGTARASEVGEASGGRRGGSRRTRAARGGPASCRACGRALVTGAERARSRCRNCPSTADELLVERLKAWRLAESRERGVPAYVVFTDATVEALAEGRPADLDGLLAVSGIGPDKASRYGEAVLALIAEAPPATPSDDQDPD